ncbi:MAG: M14 family zinc carboxypeptidase [Anaerolineae bacterium]|jgi:hypothetical protein
MNERIWLPALILQVLLLSTGTLFPRASRPLPTALQHAPDGDVVARVYVRDRDHLKVVAGKLDIWETHPEEGYVVAALAAGQEEWLSSLGYRLEVDARRTRALGAEIALDPRFYYFDEQHPNQNGRYVVDFLQEVNARYPELTELVDIGDAWMAGQEGEPDRDIWVLRVTNEQPFHGDFRDRPAFFLAATMHAREVVASELAIRYVRYLTSGYQGEGGYGVDADVTWLVDHHVAYVLVMQNPDGHVENQRDTGNNRRKNMDRGDGGCTVSGNWGVDLNRNHSFLWGCCGGSSSDPCDRTYRGPSPGSEPETEAFESYFATVMQDQNGPNGDDEIAPRSPITTTGVFISLHSYGDLVLWPWSFEGYGRAPNEAELRTIGRKFALYSGYSPAGGIGYEADGTIDDWTYGKFGIASYTFEVGPQEGDCRGFFPPYECIDGYDGRAFWDETKQAFLYAHRIARTPYLRAYGPDTQSVTFLETGASGAAVGQITAAIADQRCCGDTPQPVGGAEYFLDALGEDGTGVPMSPLDGGWGDLSETAVALVDTSGLTSGQHYVMVHGQNEDGLWGPFSAAFFLPAGHRLYLPLMTRD